MTTRAAAVQSAPETGLKPAVRLARLRPEDAAAVDALYRLANERTPYGHLADRRQADFEEVLADESGSASVGAWHDDTLVAYSLTSVHRGPPVFTASPLLAELQRGGTALWTGKGTVIDPRFEGRMLMTRMLKERGRLISERGDVNAAGLIATSNIASLAAALRAGSWVVGFERDEQCDNFVCYSGTLQDTMAGTETIDMMHHDHPAIRELIAQGWVADRLMRGEEARKLRLIRLASARSVGTRQP